MIQSAPVNQKQPLAAFIQRYTTRTQTSKQLAQTYRPVFADPRNSLGFFPPLKELCYPIVGQRSAGARLWDVDGNEYIDLMMSFGVNLLGHNPPFITAALQAQLEKGIQLGPQAELAGEVAALISELTGHERVAFSNTGTEAVMTAVRVARAATKRPKIAVFAGSYHGHFDSALVKASRQGGSAAAAIAAGIVPSLVADVLVLEYDSPLALEMIEAHQQELAAVLVEPIQSSRLELQPRQFLHQLRQVTAAAGIALIFDEMVTGFRLHLGGAQAWFGVEADLATYGKIVGGGLPIGILAGKAAYLDMLDGGQWQYGDASAPQVETTFFAGTYCKHPLAMVAAKAMLNYLKQQGPALQAQLNQRTTQFVQQLNTDLTAAGVPIRMVSGGSLFGLPGGRSGGDRADSSPAALGLNLLTYHLRDRGILLRGNSGFLSTAHTDADLAAILAAIKDSLDELRNSGFLAAKS
ncbi:aspartate aminotransferase family protein [Almyronema epifaneia]|uniref:Aspartate aminotransferase family protein n=1 Tax=Almyronema epifaneia S1 TaxID=2991925 RepID=A0ABW6IKA1_9CYAN